MKDNTVKYNLMSSTRDSNQIEIGNSLIKDTFSEALSGVRFDHELTLINTSKC